MDRIKTIIAAEWKAYWRRFSRAGLRAGNQGIILLFSGLIAVKYVQLLLIATANVEKGDQKALVPLLAAVFLVWLFPLASSSRHTIGSRKWMHLPLALKERFFLRSISLIIPPSTWLVLAGSLAICYPLAHARKPTVGVIAGFLFVMLAWLTGLTMASLLSSSSWRILLGISSLLVLSLAAVYVIRKGLSRDLLSISFLPSVFVIEAAMSELRLKTAIALAILSALTAAAAGAAFWSFRKSLTFAEIGINAKPRILSSRVIPGRLGGLISKDLTYSRKLLDIYLGVAVAVLGCIYLTVSEVPSRGIFWSFMVAVFLCNCALGFNCFGLDNRPGLDRYSLLPLSGRAVLLSKNFAFLIIVGFQIAPMLLLGGWRLGIFSTLLAAVESAALACAYLSWGNWMSVNHPLKTEFFRFSNSGAALVDSMGGIIFGSAPGIALIYLWQEKGLTVVAETMVILVVTGALYLASVTRFGTRFTRNRERMAESVS